MNRLRHIAAWGLFAILVVGGVVAPLAHRVQHGAERVAERSEACHPSSVHLADTATLAEGVEGAALACDLCATRLLVVPPDLTPMSVPRIVGPARVVLRTHLAPVHVVSDRPIRGPPSFSEARLA